MAVAMRIGVSGDGGVAQFAFECCSTALEPSLVLRHRRSFAQAVCAWEQAQWLGWLRAWVRLRLEVSDGSHGCACACVKMHGVTVCEEVGINFAFAMLFISICWGGAYCRCLICLLGRVYRITVIREFDRQCLCSAPRGWKEQRLLGGNWSVVSRAGCWQCMRGVVLRRSRVARVRQRSTVHQAHKRCCTRMGPARDNAELATHRLGSLQSKMRCSLKRRALLLLISGGLT